jgi:hypothetical protein
MPSKPPINTNGTSPHTQSDENLDNIDSTIEFEGDVNTNNDLPTQATLKKIENLPILDKDGKSLPFKNLYTGPGVTRRVLIIFIRHFFCGVRPPPFSLLPSDESKLTARLSETELPRIHPHPHLIHNPRVPPALANPNIHLHNRSRRPLSNPDVHVLYLLSVPRLRRPDEETLQRAWHAANPELRLTARISTKGIREFNPEWVYAVVETIAVWQDVPGWGLSASRWRIHV